MHFFPVLGGLKLFQYVYFSLINVHNSVLLLYTVLWLQSSAFLFDSRIFSTCQSVYFSIGYQCCSSFCGQAQKPGNKKQHGNVQSHLGESHTCTDRSCGWHYKHWWLSWSIRCASFNFFFSLWSTFFFLIIWEMAQFLRKLRCIIHLLVPSQVWNWCEGKWVWRQENAIASGTQRNSQKDSRSSLLFSPVLY